MGTTSLVGAYSNYKKNLICFPTAIYFGVASVLTVFMVRLFVIPLVPAQMGVVGGYQVSFSFVTMVLFALLMWLAAISIIWNVTLQKRTEYSRRK